MIYYRLHDEHVRLLLDLSREHLRHGAAGESRRTGGRRATRRGRAPR
jgi:hypothetical protein